MRFRFSSSKSICSNACVLRCRATSIGQAAAKCPCGPTGAGVISAANTLSLGRSSGLQNTVGIFRWDVICIFAERFSVSCSPDRPGHTRRGPPTARPIFPLPGSDRLEAGGRFRPVQLRFKAGQGLSPAHVRICGLFFKVSEDRGTRGGRATSSFPKLSLPEGKRRSACPNQMSQ